MLNYLQWVELEVEVLKFIKASHMSDIKLHIKTGEQIGKLFFSMDILKYMRLWPRYYRFEGARAEVSQHLAMASS